MRAVLAFLAIGTWGLGACANQYESFKKAERAYEAQSYDDAFRLVVPAAEAGLAPAQNLLGILYATGLGTRQDMEMAAKWYRAAAEQGYDLGQTNLGDRFQEGCGVEKDEAEAARWYAKAATQGCAIGQHKLGWLYKDGRGVAQDKRLAMELFVQAAEQCYGPALLELFSSVDSGGDMRLVSQSVERFFAEQDVGARLPGIWALCTKQTARKTKTPNNH